MNVYLSGGVVESIIPLADNSGNPLIASRVEYRVVDSENNELVAPTLYVADGDDVSLEPEEQPEEPGITEEQPLAEDEPEEQPEEPSEEPKEEITEVSILTSAEVNSLQEEQTRDIRVICLTVTNDKGAVHNLEYAYGLRISDPLIVGENSFLSYRQAQKLAMDIPKMNNWENTSQTQRISALMEARNRICRLTFDFSQVQYDMTKQDYVVQVAGKPRSVRVDEIFGACSTSKKLEDLTPEEFESLPQKFKNALAMAQLAEANDVLEVDSIADRRRQGLILETIGEVKQMFSSILPANTTISSKAMGYLSRYLATGKKLGRS